MALPPPSPSLATVGTVLKCVHSEKFLASFENPVTNFFPAPHSLSHFSLCPVNLSRIISLILNNDRWSPPLPFLFLHRLKLKILKFQGTATRSIWISFAPKELPLLLMYRDSSNVRKKDERVSFEFFARSSKEVPRKTIIVQMTLRLQDFANDLYQYERSSVKKKKEENRKKNCKARLN